MNAVVVFESHWGNTAAIAHAIAEGIGPGTAVLTTDEATSSVIEDAELIVAGAPLMVFRLPTEGILETLPEKTEDAPAPPDVSHPSMRSWLETLPAGHAPVAAFETRVRWSPGSATGTIERGLGAAGYRRVAEAHRFYVRGTYGPLRYGELETARAWGRALAQAIQPPDEAAEPVAQTG